MSNTPFNFAAGNDLADHTCTLPSNAEHSRGSTMLLFLLPSSALHLAMNSKICARTMYQERLQNQEKKKRVQPCDMQFVVEPQMDRQTRG